ncbi:MAG TPA: LLM class flavin-dependent oxidoreductase [Candidatus Binataceae bacterium]|nr:LLM class flavin-dependent oxidoreductase [Candidatus Binataceae bacterium]
MHVGYGVAFQNPHNAISDAEVYRNELRLCEMAEPLGFDSLWSVEHHFDDYTMCPDVLQFLAYMAGKTSKVKLGSMVVVLPWHDPIRVAEQISVLDHVSNGRFILGLGRGLARIEYEGFRLDQNEGRNLFVEYAELVLNALENGYMEGGKYTRQPRRDIRPFPSRSFKGRTYAAAVSPESMPIMAKLGVGLLVIPQKPWEAVKADFEIYHKVWREVNGAKPAPKPLSGGFCFVDENKDRAEEMAMKYISDYYHTAMAHYEMTSQQFGTHKSYEFYRNVGKYISKNGLDGAAADFARLMPWGTPDQVLEKIAFIKDTIDANGVMLNFSYAGMPFAEADRNLKCFAKHVLPELKKMKTDELNEPSDLDMPSYSRAS